jgi:hypothetical protein
VPLSEVIKLVNIGTLFGFILVNVGVIILRCTRPDMPGRTACPGRRCCRCSASRSLST